jgi:hypothetical protein
VPRRRQSFRAKSRCIEYERLTAAAEAKRAVNAAGKRKRRALTQSDVAAVGHRLNEAAYSLLAIRRLAIDGGDEQDGWYAVAIQELARSTFKGIDACIQRLQPGCGIGNFASEFDRD